MRRAFILGLFFAWASAAQAAPPSVSAQATPAIGKAPLAVTLTATGDAVSYSWDLGDGARADGPVVSHAYATGRYTATVTASAADGSTAQASVAITAVKLFLTGPGKTGTYGRRATLRGMLLPVMRGAQVTLRSGETLVARAKTGRRGRFRFRTRLRGPAAYTAAFESVVSDELAVAVRPALDVSLPRSGTIGRRLLLRAAIHPAGAGALQVRVWRYGREIDRRVTGDRARLRLPTRRTGEYRVQIAVLGEEGFANRSVSLRASVHLPYLGLGSRGPSVRILERRLAQLRFALRGIDGLYAQDTYEAVLAFQKLKGMARTGRADPALWRRLAVAHVPRPRYRGGHHIEVDKSRQVLFEVEGARVVRVVHVSTGATGNTPIGRWHVYSKVPGFLASGMYYSSFFLRGFAIHGYHSVPAYPASHGCVRVPIWVAPSLFAWNSYGETIYVY